MPTLETIERNINKMRSMGASEQEINIYKQGALQQAQGGQMATSPQAFADVGQAMSGQTQAPVLGNLQLQRATFTGGKPSISFAKPTTKTGDEIQQQEISKEIGRTNVKRQIYRKDLQSFLELDNILQQARGKELEAYKIGGSMAIQALARTPLGQVVRAHRAARKRLRVQLVRAAGDVGNINIVEQKAAEKLIMTEWDDIGSAEIKRAYLQDLGRAIEDENPTNVRAVLDKMGIEYTIKGQKKTFNKLWE